MIDEEDDQDKDDEVDELENLLLHRLRSRNLKQQKGFEELALVFAFQQRKSSNLAQQLFRISKTGDGIGSGGGDGGESNMSSKMDQKKSQVVEQKFPVTMLDLERQLRKVQDELDVAKEQLAVANKKLRVSNAQIAVLNKENQEKSDIITSQKEELNLTRQAKRHTETLLVEMKARATDLETRMVNERVRLAEEMNTMNDLLAQAKVSTINPGKVGSDSPGLSPPKQELESVASSENVGGSTGAPPQNQGAVWVANVGVKLPTCWKVITEAQGTSIPTLCYNGDGTVLVSGGVRNGSRGVQGVLQLWSAHTGSKLRNCSATTNQALFSVDMKSDLILGTSNRYSTVWRNTDRGLEALRQLQGEISSVFTGKITHDRQYAITGGRLLKIWDLKTGSTIRTMDASTQCLSLDVNEQGTVLVSSHGDKVIRTWDLRSGKRIDEASSVHNMAILSVCFGPGGGQVLSNSRDKSLCLLPVERLNDTSQYLRFRHPEYSSNHPWSRAAMSPQCTLTGKRYVAAGSKGGGIFIWDATTTKPVYNQLAHSKPINTVVWNPNGQQLASCDNDGIIVLWNASKK